MSISVGKFKKWLTDPSDHLVDFYSSPDSFVATLLGYMASGMEQGDSCIIIAKPLYLRKLREEIAKNQDLSIKLYGGGCTIINAQSVMESIMVNNLPNEKKFFSTMGNILEKAAKRNRPIRVYGEMVAPLWEGNNKEAAIELEKLWNKLARNHVFSLYCAYPDRLFRDSGLEREMVNSYHNFCLSSA